ncbi:IGP family C type lectin domain [Trypanosoma vivax]|nr:IGP family C type lectin domain [Trypanosoma vivax]
MTTDARARTAACVRTAGAWPLLLLLCVHVACHARLASAEDGRVTVNVRRYLSLPSESFRTAYDQRVDYSSSDRLCREAGAVLAADQSDAAHKAIFDQFHSYAKNNQELYSFLGGDALSNAAVRREPTKWCKAGDKTTSLNCVYRWNKGLFATASNGDGAAFWRGSLYGVSGSAAMNGYPPHWNELYPKDSYLNIVECHLNDKHAMYWRDVNSAQPHYAQAPIQGTYVTSYIAVCESQDSISSSTTTTRPPTTTTTTTTTTEAPRTTTTTSTTSTTTTTKAPTSTTTSTTATVAPTNTTSSSSTTESPSSPTTMADGSSGPSGGAAGTPSSSSGTASATSPGPVGNATSAPPVPGGAGHAGLGESSTWAERYWYVILLVFLSVIVAIVLIVLLFVCRSRSRDGEKVTPMVLRESFHVPYMVGTANDTGAYYADAPPFVPPQNRGMERVHAW